MKLKSSKRLVIAISLLLLTACSRQSGSTQPELGLCNSDQKIAVSDHISGQISALEKLDFKKAYTYAAKSFQEGFTLDQFEAVISGQYQMLITNTGYRFTECLVEEGYFVQSVSVATDSDEIDLTYRLTLIDKRLGVVAVTVKPSPLDLNT
jgi:hypothetical protein